MDVSANAIPMVVAMPNSSVTSNALGRTPETTLVNTMGHTGTNVRGIKTGYVPLTVATALLVDIRMRMQMCSQS